MITDIQATGSCAQYLASLDQVLRAEILLCNLTTTLRKE